MEAFDALLDTYNHIGRLIPLLKGYEELIRTNGFLRDAIVEVYEVILEFHIRAVRYFQSGSWKKLFKAAWSTFMTQFQPHMKKLESLKSFVEQHALLQHMTDFEQHAKEFKLFKHEQTQRFEEHVQREREELAKRETEQRAFLQGWLLTDKQGEQDQEHDQHLSTLRSTPSSCAWVLQREELERWFDDPENEASLLWLKGKPGAGKTILASFIIDHCEKACRSAVGKTVARYYCKYGTSTRDDFFAIARSLIWQLASNDRSMMEWLYEEASWSGLLTLSTNEKLCKDLLTTVLKSMDTVYVVIDGIDECRIDESGGTNEPQRIEEYFRTVCGDQEDNSQNHIRCLFIGQHDGVCGKLFSKYPTLAITEPDTQADLTIFVKKEIATIQEEFELDDDIAEKLIQRLIIQSEGMFLYARLVTLNLRKQPDLEHFQAEVNSSLPKGKSLL